MNEIKTIQKYRTTIHDLINLIGDHDKREKTLQAFTEFEDVFLIHKGSYKRHQSYTGGLKDHTILVTLVSISTLRNMITPLNFLFNVDDTIISCIFHDFDKLGKYTNDGIFATHMDVIEWLDEYGLNNARVRDGILHSHGGWSGDNELHGPTGIIVHFSDMVASQIKITEEETIRMIIEIENYIYR